ncbi:MAG TPA: 50S ribosomal protein L11 methyltransferase [Thermoanaerobaculia bacterium]|jgi:hypothetical protein|nr:50S ribosomal protein L11 methyltransferase [Thermoanaerobaculia bacterium]
MLWDYHRRLIADEPRTIAFRDAIRSAVTPESVVLDLGSGSGILSFFACEAGARRVFAIDDGHMADAVALLARHLGFADRLQVFHAHSLKVELPERATVLVTETLGAFGLDEQILSSVIDARARLLRPDATIIPRDLTMIVAPVEVPEQYEQRVTCWSERYGFDFSPLRPFTANFIHPHRAMPGTFLAEPGAVISVDVARAAATKASGTAHFRAGRAGTLHGFAGWFTSSLTPEITVTGYGPTSWNQVFLPLTVPVAVAEGAPISVTVETDDGAWFRWRGTANGSAFDQCTVASAPPCTLQ